MSLISKIKMTEGLDKIFDESQRTLEKQINGSNLTLEQKTLIMQAIEFGRIYGETVTHAHMALYDVEGSDPDKAIQPYIKEYQRILGLLKSP